MACTTCGEAGLPLRRLDHSLEYWSPYPSRRRSSATKWIFTGAIAIEFALKAYILAKALVDPPNVLKPHMHLAQAVIAGLVYGVLLSVLLFSKSNPIPGLIVLVFQYFMCIGGVAALLTRDLSSPSAKLAMGMTCCWHLFVAVMAIIYLRWTGKVSIR